MKTVIIYYKNGSMDVKDCWELDEICLDGVDYIKVIRDESIKLTA
jgi:hypothetical protein